MIAMIKEEYKYSELTSKIIGETSLNFKRLSNKGLNCDFYDLFDYDD